MYKNVLFSSFSVMVKMATIAISTDDQKADLLAVRDFMGIDCHLAKTF
jgi:hypothetical protein